MNRLVPYSGEVYAYLVEGYADAHQTLAILFALAAVALLVIADRPAARAARGTAGVGLALIWAWIGFGFYWQTYQPLNWAGNYFGWAALVQAALIAVWAVQAPAFRPAFRWASPVDCMGLAGLTLAVLTGPFTRLLSGDAVIAAQAAGVTPLATITATLALFLLNRARIPFWLLPVPVALLCWEGVRAQVLGLVQDGALLAVSACILVLLLRRFARPG